MPVHLKHAVKPKSASAEQLSGAKSTSSGDVLFQIVKKVETGSRATAHQRVKELIVARGLTDFEIGGWLSLVREGGSDWLNGHDSFNEYCWKVCGFRGGKGWHLTKVYKLLSVNNVPWDDVDMIGWWKLSMLARAKIDKKNLAKWLAKAKTLNVEQLKNELKGGKATSKAGPLTIRVHHDDQKETVRAGLDKAKSEANTKYDAVALHNVMQAYLGNAVTMEFKCPQCGGCATSAAKLEEC